MRLRENIKNILFFIVIALSLGFLGYLGAKFDQAFPRSEPQNQNQNDADALVIIMAGS